MKNKNRNVFRGFTFIIISLFMFFTYSCLDPEWDFEKFSDEVVLTPGLAAPIAYGSLSLDEVLNEIDGTNYIKRFDDSLLYISYSNQLFSYPANEVLAIPTQNFMQFFIESDVALSPEWISSALDDTVRFIKDKSGEFEFSNNEKIDSMHIKDMDLVINVESSFKHSGVLSITSDAILVNGEPFQEVIQISDASGNFSISRTIPMDENSIYLDNSSPDVTILPIRFELELINSGNPVLPGESCDITMNFVDPQFYSIFGYLGDHELITSSGDIVIDIYDTDTIVGGGSILFANPMFHFDIANSYGLPVQVDVMELEAYSRINDVTTPVVFESGVNPFSIGAPAVDAIGDSVNTRIEINKETSNIDEVIKTSPSEFSYRVKAITNPDGPQSVQNFATDSSNFLVDFEVILPLWLKAEGFTVDETYAFDFEEDFGEDADIIDYLRVTMDAVNQLPMEIKMQVYFLDENSNTLDSLFLNDDLLLPASLDEDSKVDEATEQSKSVEFTKEKIDRIRPTKELLVKATATTADPDSDLYVKLYSYYAVDFKLKMKADLIVNSRDQ
ncbi:MAG: hypothetical protein ACOCZL_00730 [Bacteroidota bacterium]